MLRSLSGWRTETTTHGLVLAIIPKSTITTSPRSNFVIVNLRCRAEFFPGVGHHVLQFAGRYFRFRRGHHPPAAFFGGHKILLTALRAANWNAPPAVRFDQSCHVGNLPHIRHAIK